MTGGEPPVIAVCGVKNSGKTTLLCGLIPLLTAGGLKVAVVKHDGHDFVPDVPGTDSFRLRQAGAQGVAVFSARRYMVTVEQPDVALASVIGPLQGADLILLEGGKASPFPKIEIVRRAISEGPVCDPEGLLALCTDTDFSRPGLRRLGLTDYPGLACVVVDFLQAFPYSERSCS